MRTSKRMLKEVRRALRAALLLGGGISMLMLAFPLYILLALSPVGPAAGLESHLLMAGLVAAALIAAAIMTAQRDLVLARAGVWLDHSLGEHIIDNGLRHGVPAGELAAQAELGHDLQVALCGPGIKALLSALWVPLYIMALALISPLLAAIATLAALLIVAPAILFSRKSVGAGSALRGASAFKDAALTRASFVPGLAQSAGPHWERRNRPAVAAVYDSAQLNAKLAAVSSGMALAALTGLVGLGSWLSLHGNLGIADIAASGALMLMTLLPLLHLAGNGPALVAARRTWRAIDALPADAIVLKCATGRTAVPTGALVMESASFTHPGRQAPALQLINLTCRRGECVAITGAAGSGKSSLGALAAGALVPSQGSVTIDGIPVAKWQRAPSAAPIGYCADDPHLIEGSVRQNIVSFAAGDNLLAEEAAQRAGVDAIIAGLSHDYGTQVGAGGANLSMRERRAVSLARACYGERAFIVIDEPETSLDAVALQAFEEVLLGLTAAEIGVIMITRNPALLDLADRIIVLDSGKASDLPRRHPPMRRVFTAAAVALH